MKTKYLIGICLIITITNSISCRKKTPSEQEQSIPQTTAAQKPATEQTQPDETEYFALFMEGKKVGYAIQNRTVDGEKVTTSIDLKITINRAGISVSIQTKVDTFETADGKPLGFES
jgi:hypothetical protein